MVCSTSLGNYLCQSQLYPMLRPCEIRMALSDEEEVFHHSHFNVSLYCCIYNMQSNDKRGDLGPNLARFAACCPAVLLRCCWRFWFASLLVSSACCSCWRAAAAAAPDVAQQRVGGYGDHSRQQQQRGEHFCLGFLLQYFIILQYQIGWVLKNTAYRLIIEIKLIYSWYCILCNTD